MGVTEGIDFKVRNAYNILRVPLIGDRNEEESRGFKAYYVPSYFSFLFIWRDWDQFRHFEAAALVLPCVFELTRFAAVSGRAVSTLIVSISRA